jgi:hypothetical protein
MTDLLSRRLVPSPDVLDTSVGKETIILHLGNDTYFEFDEIGSIIWSKLKEGLALVEIRDCLSKDFSVNPERIEADMLSFLQSLLQHDILLLDG